MRLNRLYVENLRNHVRTDWAPAARVNVLTGRNGAGKTSLLEGISLCTLARSFVANQDVALVRRGSDSMRARVEAESEYGAPRRIDFSYAEESGKRIALDGSSPGPASRVIGALPTVVLFPDLKAITGGPPTHRRRFLDLVLSQAKRKYLEDLMVYRRLLKQRNAMLGRARREGRRLDPQALEAWDEGLIDRGSRIMVERADFVRSFAPILRSTAAEVALDEEVDIVYEPDGIDAIGTSINDVRDALWYRSKSVAAKEARRGTTMFGPHRDEISMTVNGGDVRTSASQGQHKTLLIGLKIAEFHYLKEESAETPIILLDDIFGDLDPERAERVFDRCRELAQIFITAVSIDMLGFLRERKFGSGEQHMSVVDGVLTEPARSPHLRIAGGL